MDSRSIPIWHHYCFYSIDKKILAIFLLWKGDYFLYLVVFQSWALGGGKKKKLATWLSDKNICSILVDREKDRTGYRCVCQARLHARITRRLIDKNEMKSLLKGNYSFYTTMIWSQLISNRNVCLFQGFGTVVCLSPKYWSVSICGDPHRSWHPFMKSLAGAYLEVQIGIRIFCCHGSYEQ